MNRREAMGIIGRGGALGALAATAAVTVQCQPIEAPAAGIDPFIARLNAYYRDRDHYNTDPNAADTIPSPYDAFCDEVDGGQFPIASAAGAVMAMENLKSLDCITDGEGLLMVDAVMDYLRRVAA